MPIPAWRVHFADLKRKLMRYVRQYNKAPRIVKWKYVDPSRRIVQNRLLQATSPLFWKDAKETKSLRVPFLHSGIARY
jgi:hypothetical protein